MIAYTEVQVPAKTERKFSIRICDMCGRQTQDADNWLAHKGEWSNDDNYAETQLSASIGNRNRDCGELRKINLDICPICFEEKLIPWLESQGVTVETHNVEW